MSACSGKGCGVVFKLDRSNKETVSYTFGGGADGASPLADLIFDNAGNLYGTASAGGNLSACSGNGCGVVFKLRPSGKQTVLHTFRGGTDGSIPLASLIFDSAGNLYSTASEGGENSGGVVFEIPPPSR